MLIVLFYALNASVFHLYYTAGQESITSEKSTGGHLILSVHTPKAHKPPVKTEKMKTSEGKKTQQLLL